MKTLFVVGPHASGKTYSIKKYLSEDSEESKKTVIDTGPIMRELHKKSGTDKNIGEWVCELENQYGPEITSEIIANEIKRRIKSSGKEDSIIIGYRTFGSIDYLLRKLDIEDFKILYIDAPMSLLFSNYSRREGNKKSLNEFEKYINEEERSGLIELKAYAMLGHENFEYFYKSNNEETFCHLLSNYFEKPKMKVLRDEQKAN